VVFDAKLLEAWKLSAKLESDKIRISTRTSLGLELVGLDIGRSETVSPELSSHFNGIGSIRMYPVPFHTVNTQCKGNLSALIGRNDSQGLV